MNKPKQAEDAPKRVGIWIRVSTDDQAQGDSPKHHEQRARYYCESKGWKAIEVYHLEGVSGKVVSEHPETKRMLRDVKRGHINALVFSKLARLARNTKELLEFAEFFQNNDADLISLQESIDTSTPAGRLFYTMIAAMATWEREEIAERVAASVPIRAKLGKPLGGQAPFGYRYVDGKLQADEKEAPVRRLMYELYVQHRRIKTVARLLNEAGHRTRSGKPFSGTTVKQMLLDPVAKGTRRTNYTRNFQNKRWELKPESDWVYQTVEAIVPEELWDQCQAILSEQRGGRTPQGKRPVHLFAGLIQCHCGKKMYVPSNIPNKYVCQACRNKIPIEDIEAIYFEQLKGFLMSEEDVETFLSHANEDVQQKEALLTALDSEQTTIRKEMDQVYRLYIDESLTSRGFDERYRPLEERLGQIEDELPKLQADLDYLRINLLSSSEVVSEATDLYSQWPKLEATDKRQIVENITEQIVIGKEDVSIDLCYLPVPHELAAKRSSTDRGSAS